MKNVVLKYGLPAGIFVSLWMLASVWSGMMLESNAFGMAVGFLSMLLAFSSIFLAIRAYRKTHPANSFGKRLQIGLLITLVISTFYVVTWHFANDYIVPDFMETYTQNSIDELRTSGASAEMIAAKEKEMNQFAESYKNPIVRAGWTYLEILPMGILISLIAAAVMKRSAQKYV